MKYLDDTNQLIGEIVRQHLYEVLSKECINNRFDLANCKIGSDYQDCSYIDYSDGLEIWTSSGRYIIMIFDNTATIPAFMNYHEHTGGIQLTIIHCKAPLVWETVAGCIPDISEPDFAGLTKLVIDTLKLWRPQYL